jgi:hypothetical protein
VVNWLAFGAALCFIAWGVALAFQAICDEVEA